MSAVTALRDGIQRVNAAPLVLAGMFLVTLLIAVPPALALRGMLAGHLGPSAAAHDPAERAAYEWWHEFRAQASGVGTTLTPSVIGFAGVLGNMSGLLDKEPLPVTIAGVTVAWLVVWSFLAGGILDRYARQRPTRVHGFFAACGTHFWRFVRLGILASLAYVVLFGTVHAWVFESVYPRLTRDLTVERTAFAVRVGGYGVFVVLLAACAVLFDYARIRIVVEDRRSAVGALAAAARFVARHARGVCALFLLNAAAFLMLIGVYGTLSSRASGTDIPLWLLIAMGQTYILGRHYLKLLVYASETALFQARLAHAAYTAAPIVVWPDSPAVETITNPEATSVR